MNGNRRLAGSEAVEDYVCGACGLDVARAAVPYLERRGLNTPT